MVEKAFDYKRKVTHTEYNNGNKNVKKGGLKGHLHTVITHNKKVVNKNRVSPENFPYANDKFLQTPTAPKILPIWGGVFLLLFVSFLFTYITSDEESVIFILVTLLFFLGFLFFAIYYYTMPNKEFILNREDGLLTFPGFMWQKNITMPIHKVIFTMSGPSVQGLGAFELLIERPDRFYSKYHATLGNNCYEDLSFYLWYMDKNRPLPPGTAFDEYRQADYERRKAAGFPKPLFPSNIPTPEATPEQQAERERIGGW
nr:hypothetical protein BACY1_17330 [Tenacibaculum mesophilum]